jgi:hypothetical protein
MKKQNLKLVISVCCLVLLFFSCKKNHEAHSNQPPKVWAGSDQCVLLSSDSFELKGIASDPDGTIVSYEWTKFYGPSSFTIVSPFAQNTFVKNVISGTYYFQLKVTDNRGLSAIDLVTVTADSISCPGQGQGDWDY